MSGREATCSYSFTATLRTEGSGGTACQGEAAAARLESVHHRKIPERPVPRKTIEVGVGRQLPLYRPVSTLAGGRQEKQQPQWRLRVSRERGRVPRIAALWSRLPCTTRRYMSPTKPPWRPLWCRPGKQHKIPRMDNETAEENHLFPALTVQHAPPHLELAFVEVQFRPYRRASVKPPLAAYPITDHIPSTKQLGRRRRISTMG